MRAFNGSIQGKVLLRLCTLFPHTQAMYDLCDLKLGREGGRGGGGGGGGGFLLCSFSRPVGLELSCPVSLTRGMTTSMQTSE